jgi:hypothetical protein
MLMRERFIPRLLEAQPDTLIDATGHNFDPHKIWATMFTNEKPGGHGERSVAMGTIDMAVWDAVAKIEGKPLFQLLADRYGNGQANRRVFVYAAGGYYYPGQDHEKLKDEMRSYIDRGYSVSTLYDPQAKADQVQVELNQADQMGKLMMVPEGMRAGLIQKMDPSLSPEEAQQIAANAAQAHAAMQDPESALAKKIQTGRDFVANPGPYARQQVLNGINPMNWFKSGSTNMNISKLIEKWALNAMDAKELTDLKAEQAKGAPYRVEDARRANTLKMRQDAEAPSKEVVIAACQKAARCWSGYEPVPGAKKFSKGSCRPKGSKKTQKEMKKS